MGPTIGCILAAALLLWPTLGAAQVPDPPGGAAAPNFVVVDSVEIVGNELLSEGIVRGTVGFTVGDTITGRELQSAERRLWETGRFADIEVTVRPGAAPDAGIFTFRVEERPVVQSRVIRGLTRLDPSDVWEAAGLEAGQVYDPQTVMDARRYIRDELAQLGIPFVQIDESLEPVVADSPGEIALILDVTEGQRITIAEVDFNGNDTFDDSRLEGVLSTRSEGFLWFRNGAFQSEALEADLSTALPEFYASEGFLDFAVVGDTLIVDPSTGKARLEVDVAEGPRYRIADFSIEGNRRFLTDQLTQYYQPDQGGLLSSLGIRRGDGGADGDPIFNEAAFQEATISVGELYSNEGYIYAQVTPTMERLPPESEGGDPRVALGWSIQEGQPAYIGRIRIVGNDYTHDRVIRERIQLLPGDVFSRDRLLRSYQAISGLGFFETPLPFPEIQPDPQTGDVDITFEVVEQQVGSMNFGTTVGGYTGLSGFVGYEHPNLFGQAKSGALRWDFGQYQNNFTLSYTDPALLQSRVSGNISLFNSRDRFFSFSTGRRRVLGTSTRLGFPIPGSLYSRLFVGYSVSRTDYDLESGVDDTSLFGRPSGVQSQLSLGLARNTLDHPLFPTIGSEQRWTVEVNGGLLGGDGDFTKHTLEGSWWIPVGQIGGSAPGSQPMRFTLGLRARAGTIFGNPENFPFERFWLGGVQFGETLRGYEETTVTPGGYVERNSNQVQDVDRLGDSFLTIGAEYALRLNQSISISAFYEAGNIWREPSDIDPSRLFRGAGLGLDLVTPFGPIGLDYAYGFDNPVPGWQLHFRMGGQQGF
ncbi:MAG: outer membrane protein assembly factor BamA [Gemmatimonadota bacterium]